MGTYSSEIETLHVANFVQIVYQFGKASGFTFIV